MRLEIQPMLYERFGNIEKTIDRIDVSVQSVILFESATIGYSFIQTGTEEIVSSGQLVLSPEEYETWNNDEDLIALVVAKLGVTQIVPGV